MEFHENRLFHIYNQGNNKQQVFFSDENYLFFLWKMRSYLHPFGDLVSYCLLPNHFHWLFFIKKISVSKTDWRIWTNEIEYQRRIKKYGKKATRTNLPPSCEIDTTEHITLNESIGILLRTYTQSVNKERETTGSIFRQHCKARDGWINEFVTATKRNGKIDTRFSPGTDYAYQCFNYIHTNPKKARLVTNDLDWNFSSAKDYAGLRNGTLCNLEIGNSIIQNF
ncbi:MAG: putative transposase [Granulosicoccus sp.]|jgi:putative transposase